MSKFFFIVFSLFVFEDSYAHVSERALVLLLPTEIYIPSGIAVLILTIVLTYFIPIILKNLFNEFQILHFNKDVLFQNWIRYFQNCFSTLSLIFILVLLLFGWYGSRDPLSNPLSLYIWTLWFIGFPILQIIFGNLWSFLNPWVGIIKILNLNRGFFILREKYYYLPAIFGFLIFSLFMLVFLSPNDPAILANVVFFYLIFNFIFIIFFGEKWLEKAECFTIFFSYLSKLSLIWFSNSKVFVGFFGARLTNISFLPIAFSIFICTILATLSFDGLNETFWWFKIINVNPLEFHGRSSVYLENTLGLICFVIFLFFVFSFVNFIGLFFIGQSKKTFQIVGIQSISLLPIALGYHVAHYLTSFIVDIQYVASTITDPLNVGDDYFNFGIIYETTGFFNTIETVNLIWIIQGSAIVIGHVLAVLLSHKICYQYLNKNREIFISQIPISCFMICYTFLGLWILSSPIAG